MVLAHEHARPGSRNKLAQQGIRTGQASHHDRSHDRKRKADMIEVAIVGMLSDPRRVYVDIDEPHQGTKTGRASHRKRQRLARSACNLERLCNRLRANGLRSDWIMYHRTAHGWHIALHLVNSITPRRCVSLQRKLGSDPRREKHNYTRAAFVSRKKAPSFWIKRWNILYERKLR